MSILYTLALTCLVLKMEKYRPDLLVFSQRTIIDLLHVFLNANEYSAKLFSDKSMINLVEKSLLSHKERTFLWMQLLAASK